MINSKLINTKINDGEEERMERAVSATARGKEGTTLSIQSSLVMATQISFMGFLVLIEVKNKCIHC